MAIPLSCHWLNREWIIIPAIITANTVLPAKLVAAKAGSRNLPGESDAGSSLPRPRYVVRHDNL